MKKTFVEPKTDRILIADFHKRLLLPATDLLRIEGYECIYTHEEVTMVEILKYIEFDILIININEISGSTIMQELSRITKKLPITLSTRNPIYDKQNHPLAPPEIACISIPIDLQELLKQVRYYTKNKTPQVPLLQKRNLGCSTL